jgi:hypothetical protein
VEAGYLVWILLQPSPSATIRLDAEVMEIAVEHRGTFLRERGVAIVLLFPHGRAVFSDAPAREAARKDPHEVMTPTADVIFF